MLTSGELVRVAGLTLRQLQWWCENGVLKPDRVPFGISVPDYAVRRDVWPRTQHELGVKVFQIIGANSAQEAFAIAKKVKRGGLLVIDCDAIKRRIAGKAA